MKITEKQIEEMAKEYAESENSAYTNDYYGFINGFKKALSLYGVGWQSEQLPIFNEPDLDEMIKESKENKDSLDTLVLRVWNRGFINGISSEAEINSK